MSLVHKILYIVVLCGTCISPAAYGQLEPRIHVKVPFAFHVEDKEFPAGEYTVKASSGQTAVLLQSTDYSRAQVVLTNSAETHTVAEQSSLVFNRYGTEYYLSMIWLAGSNSGRQLTPSRQEKELAQKSADPGKTILAGTLTPSKH
jgi:hypothetical protein